MKTKDVLKYNSAIMKIIDNATDIDALGKFRLLGILKQLQPTIENYNNVRDDLIRQHANIFGDNSVAGIVEPNRDNFENEEDYIEAFNHFTECKNNFDKDIEKLDKSVVNIDIKKLNYQDVMNAGIPSAYLLDIYDLIEE